MIAPTRSVQVAARIPRATCRLQFNESFRLADAVAFVPYLHELGISHIYASPLFAARPHSTHGYDVCDFGQLNPELGTENDLARLVDSLRVHEMGLVLDIVPNHMGIGGPECHWWWDVLAFGRDSPFAGCFDIDWDSTDEQLRDKVMVPILGDEYERALGRGEFRLAVKDDGLELQYLDHWLPVSPGSLAEARSRAACPALSAAALAAECNADPEKLDELIRAQHYVLIPWRRGNTDLNYRRFFSIATLAGLRCEDEEVFRKAHVLIADWLERGWLDGLRVDHPDGLRDPQEYLRRLHTMAPNAWIVVEKILQPGECLPAAWPVAGTTGYDFLNLAGGLLIDPAGERPLSDFHGAFTGELVDYATLAGEKKRLALRELLMAEVKRLTRLAGQIVENAKPARKFTEEQLRTAIIELAASLPVYRTYVRPESGKVDAADSSHLEKAIASARDLVPETAAGVIDFLGSLLLLESRGPAESDFVLRFQQLTGAAMAKGVEDTAFYCFNRLAALNEVGGSPARFRVSVEEFHAACRTGQIRWPDTMLATSTHDTKRSEDARARLSLLSEIPQAWHRAVSRWSAINERHRLDGQPDRNAEYLFYQTLVAAWPLLLDRALAYMEKAMREARQHTSWAAPDERYEQALRKFVSAALADAGFIRELEQFLAPLVEAGYVNSLSQTLLKLTAPGVPDILGCELWDFSLVDPDNRRPVDFATRRRLLAEAGSLPVGEIWRRRSEGLPKLWLIRKTLELRRRRPNWLAGASAYEALSAIGTQRAHVVAFTRGGGVVTVTQRLPLVLEGNWKDTALHLPAGRWRDELGGQLVLDGAVPLAVLLAAFPVALLSRMEAE